MVRREREYVIEYEVDLWRFFLPVVFCLFDGQALVPLTGQSPAPNENSYQCAVTLQ